MHKILKALVLSFALFAVPGATSADETVLTADNVATDRVLLQKLTKIWTPLRTEVTAITTAALKAEANREGSLFTSDDRNCIEEALGVLNDDAALREAIAEIQSQPRDVRARWVPLGYFLKSIDGDRYLQNRLDAAFAFLDGIAAIYRAQAIDGSEEVTPLLTMFRKQDALKKQADQIIDAQPNADALRTALEDFSLKDGRIFDKISSAVFEPRMKKLKNSSRCD